MKIGMNLLLWTGHVTEEHREVLEAIKACGYDGVEIPVMQTDVKHYQSLRPVLDDLDLACTCSTAMPDSEHDPISDDGARRAAGIDHLKRVIDCAQALGAGVICGPTFQTLGRFTGSGPTDTEKDRARAAHRLAAEHAAPANVTIATEPLNRFECYFLNTMSDAAAHARQINHSNFGVLYDTFHANIEEKDPVGAIAPNTDVIRHVHISENDRGTPGKGHVDFKATLSALRAAGYDDWLVIESFGRALPELAAATCVWRDFFASREEVYQDGFRFVKDLWSSS